MPRIIIEAHQHRFGIHAMELPSAIANIDTYFVTSEPVTSSPALARFVDTLHQQARL